MKKPNIHSINPLDFLQVVPTRDSHINEAKAEGVPQFEEYTANRLAKALHPAIQHVKIAEITEHSKDVKSFKLVADTEKGTEALAYFDAGQYLSISVKVGEVEVTRPYSLSSSPKEALEGFYTLTIKRAGGLVSEFALDNFKVGDSLDVSAPLGEFTYQRLRDAKKVVGIAGGSGITPFYSLAKAVFDGTEDFELTLLYGSNTMADAIFEKEFKEIEQKCDKFHLVNVLSNEKVEGCESGFITKELIEKYAPKDEYSIFICGPKAMYSFVDKEIEKLNLRKKFIRHELFGEYRNPQEDEDYPKDAKSTVKVTVRMCGKEQEINASASDTLLVSMEKAGIKTSARCRSGVCGWCHSRLISGNVYVPKSVDGRRLADFEYGYIHPCCTFPTSDVVIDVPPFKA